MAILVFLLVLSVLIFVHEAGHFLAAKWAKIKVEEFGFGYPPKAMRLFRWKGTDFTLNWIPFGGFVRMKGEDPAPDQKPEKGDFYFAGVLQRLVVIVAGVTANFLLAIVIFTLVFGRMGIPELIDQPRISATSPDSPAAEANLPTEVNIIGFKYGEEVVNVQTVDDVVEEIAAHRGENVSLLVSGPCKGLTCGYSQNEYQVYLRTEAETPNDQGSLGVVFDNVVYVFYPAWEMPWRSVVYGTKEAIALGGLILQVLKETVSGMVTGGKLPGDIAGPVGIVYQAQSSGLFEQGWLSVLSFAAMLSVNLAIMNLLPIPPLDGGRAVFALIETLIGKKRARSAERSFNYFGYIILMGLILAVTARDIWRIFKS